MVTRLAIVALVSACSLSNQHYVGPNGDDDGGTTGDDDAVAVFRSGSRLQVIDTTYPDGTKSFSLEAHDSQLDADCFPIVWSDGMRYCAPLGGSVFYADSGCTVPVVETDSATAATPIYAFAQGPNGPDHLYRSGAATSHPQYFTPVGTDCMATTLPIGAVVFEVGAEIQTSELVAMTQIADDPGEFSNLYTRGADGYQQANPFAFQDNVHGSECFIIGHSPVLSAFHCPPENARFTTIYSDAACTMPLSPGPTTTELHYVAPYPKGGGCLQGQAHSYQTISTTPATGATYQWDPSTGACTATTDGSIAYQLAGDDVELTAFSHRPAAQTGRRIEAGHLATPTQTFLDSDLFDTTLNSWCQTMPLADGTTRCVPEGFYLTNVYTDSSCQQSIKVVEVDEDCGSTLPQYALESASPSVVVRPRGDIVLGTLYEMGFGGTCDALSQPNVLYFSVGLPLPATSFEIGTQQVEPTVP